MKNTTKVKINLTKATVAVLFVDGSAKVTTEELTGKYTLNNARKAIKENAPSDFGENKEVKNVEVLNVEHTQRVFEVDTDNLYAFIEASVGDFVTEVNTGLEVE